MTTQGCDAGGWSERRHHAEKWASGPAIGWSQAPECGSEAVRRSEIVMSEVPESESSRALFEAHPRVFEENRYVYPVLSRRARGISIGVNLTVYRAFVPNGPRPR